MAGLLIVGSAIQLARQSGTPALDSLWAEDGAQFLGTAVRRGIPASLVLSSVGYLHTIPRLFGAVASATPLTFASAILSGGAALFVALLSAYVVRASRMLFRELWPALLLGGLTLLLPTAGWETMNNITNLQWYLLFPCYLALVTATRTQFETFTGLAVVLATTLSTPAAVALAPIAVWNLFKSAPDARRQWVSIAFVAGMAVQVVAVLLSETWPTEANRPGTLPGLYGLRVVGALLVGQRFLPGAWDALRWGFGFGALGVAAVVVGLGIRRAPARLQVLAPLALSVVLFAGPVLIRGTSLVDPEADTLMVAGSRWVTAPILFLAASLFMSIEALLARASRRGVAFTWGAIGLVIVFTVVTSYEVRNLRSEAPRWRAAVRSAEGACRDGGVGFVRIPISPPGWTTMLPCRSLE